MKSKKGQITLFIVIGLILLLGAGIAIYLAVLREPAVIEQAELPAVQQVPAEAEPIREYVRNCIYETAKEAIIKLGEHGGYISTENLKYNPFEPTEDEAVQFSRNSELIIPYWSYLKSQNTCSQNCEFATKRPTTSQIKRQIETYIDTQLTECLGTYSLFPTYTFYERKAPSTTATLGKQNIVVYTEYPLRVERGTTSFEIPDYATSLDVNLKEIYDTATKLTELEQQYGYLEKYTNQLISIYSRLDSDVLPPTSELDINLGAGTMWTEPQIREKITAMLASYIPLLQVPGTLNYRNREAPAETIDPALYRTLYNRNMAVLLDEELKETHPTLAVTFSYLDWWKPYTDVCPGQVCQAETMTNTIPVLGMIIGIQRYKFGYDLSFPVLVEIKNPFAFKGEGYSFKFFLEHNMRANQPMRTDYQRLEMMDISGSTMMCKKEHWNSGNFTIIAKNGRTGQNVEEAQIAFNCGAESCSIGTTGPNGELETKLPRCMGGILMAEKNLYHPANLVVDTSAKNAQRIVVTIEPYRVVNISTMKWLIKKTGPENWNLDETGRAHPEADEDTIIMMRKQTAEFEEPFTATAEVCGGLTKAKIPCGTGIPDNSKGIRMLPGKYDVTIYNFRYPQPAVVIPPDRRCYPNPIGEPKCFYIPQEDIVFDKTRPMPTGTAEFEWELTKDNLDSADSIVFSYLYFALDKLPKQSRKIEDLEQIGLMDEYSQQYRSYLEPEIK